MGTRRSTAQTSTLQHGSWHTHGSVARHTGYHDGHEVLPPSADEEGCLSEVFAYLWAKHPGPGPKAGKSCLPVGQGPDDARVLRLPETVVFKFRQPAAWYFVTSDGQVRRKRAQNITNASIYAAFSRAPPLPS